MFRILRRSSTLHLEVKKKKEVKRLFTIPCPSLFPHRNHVSLAGQCINIYFCSECCTSVVSLWTILTSLSAKERQLMSVYWSTKIRWQCRPYVKPRRKLDLALLWSAMRDWWEIILHFEAASTGCWSVGVKTTREWTNICGCLRTDTDGISEPCERTWFNRDNLIDICC